MLELNGIVEKIEKTEITNVDLVSFKFEGNRTKMNLELVSKYNPFEESDPVKIIFNTKPHSEENLKLILNGFLYSSTKNEDIYKIRITVGGLQLQIDTSEEYDEFKIKKELVISFL